MRERLTAAVLALTLALLVVASGARAIDVYGSLRAETSLRLTQELRLVVLLLAQDAQDAQGPDDAPDRELLAGAVPRTAQLTYRPLTGEEVVVTGADYVAGSDVVRVTDTVGDAEVTLAEPGSRLWRVALGDGPSLAALLLVLLVLAVVGSLVAARQLAGPFRVLEEATRDLARGRLDPRLPDTAVPEARGVGEGLRVIAERMRERLLREQRFATQASHELRTPLTRVRLALDELSLTSGADPDVTAAVEHCLTAVADAERVSGELVSLMWRDGVLSGLTSPVRVMATDVTEHWADRLDEHDRAVTAAVEGDTEAEVAVGQVEAVLELLLEEVLHAGEGETRLVFETTEGQPLRVEVLCAAGRPAQGIGGAVPDWLARAGELATAMGGRLEGDCLDGIRLTLPRR